MFSTENFALFSTDNRCEISVSISLLLRNLHLLCLVGPIRYILKLELVVDVYRSISKPDCVSILLLEEQVLSIHPPKKELVSF